MRKFWIIRIFSVFVCLNCFHWSAFCSDTVNQNRFHVWPSISHYPGAQILWRCLCVFPPLPWSPPIPVQSLTQDWFPALADPDTINFMIRSVSQIWYWMLSMVSKLQQNVCLCSDLQNARDRLCHLRFCRVQSVSDLLQLVAALQ